jgi:hypothetical protein
LIVYPVIFKYNKFINTDTVGLSEIPLAVCKVTLAPEISNYLGNIISKFPAIKIYSHNTICKLTGMLKFECKSCGLLHLIRAQTQS